MSTDIPEPDLPETDSPATELEDSIFSDEDGVLYDEEVTPEFGILGFTLRELLIVGVWLVSFILSFFPLTAGVSLWGLGIQWILPIAVPTVAVFLLVLRRFSPDGIRRVGSLGIDQFASVAFSVAAVVWAGSVWLAISGVIATGFWTLPWNGVAMFVLSVALVVLTVFAPIIPGVKEDFHGRLVTLAHRNANPVRPVIPRPRIESVPASSSEEAEKSEDERTDVIVDGGYGAPGADLDVESSGRQATDEIARLDLADQVPLTAHASGGGLGTEPSTADEEYVPAYSRRSRGRNPRSSPTRAASSHCWRRRRRTRPPVPQTTRSPRGGGSRRSRPRCHESARGRRRRSAVLDPRTIRARRARRAR
ncbi:hypothetical protein [Microbacterium sp. Se5.02b]|uniref:hypothetical protein n=1 Tax=Microbacterium sp. Se5.02b TaxID=2864103 RepID=UPI001C68CE0C|nr:hypothetical protein [Microbacterium sp. Se5.02b]QYM63066.1 hypothetical protein K1X59_12130 [Microbacterium sp. Se5.02b]